MRRFSTTALILALCAITGFAAEGVPGQSVPAQDEQAIRQRLALYAQARTDRDAHKEALCYTEDGDFRSSQGPFVRGREAVEKQLTVNDPSYRFQLDVVSMRMIDPNVAVVEADLMTGVGGKLGKLVGTYVMSKRNGEWLINAARIARAVAPPAAAATAH
jgi:uncharacterized protein (TIGR02246 family)